MTLRVPRPRDRRTRARGPDLASTIDGELEPYTRYVDWHQNDDVTKKMWNLTRKRLKGMDRKSAKLLAAEIIELTKKRGGK